MKILIFLLVILVGCVLFCLKKAHDAVWIEDEEIYLVFATGGIFGILICIIGLVW